MFLRQVSRAVAISLSAVACCGGLYVRSPGQPGRSSTLTSSDGNTALNTVGTVAAGSPYTSGQQVQVQVQANSVLSTANLSGAGAPTTASSSGGVHRPGRSSRQPADRPEQL